MKDNIALSHQIEVVKKMLELYLEDRKDIDQWSKFESQTDQNADRQVSILEVKHQGRVYRYTSEWTYVPWNGFKHAFYFSRDGEVVRVSVIHDLLIRLECALEKLEEELEVKKNPCPRKE